MSASESSGSGMGLGGVLGVVFVVLKLVHVIDWSWWWVLCPFWIGIAIWSGFMLLLAVGAVIASLGSGRRPRGIR